MELVQVFSSGGGKQSAAISALIVQGRLPKPDLAVIADTGRECESTWDYLDAVVRPALWTVGLEVHRIGPEWKSTPKHGRDWQSHNGNTTLLPLFTDESGSVGKLGGYCSKTWKEEVVNRYLSRMHGLTRSQYRKWIGFSFDEVRRVNRIMASEEAQKGLIWLPLVQGVPMARQHIPALIREMGWPDPPRSRCWMCPNQHASEWRELQEQRPDEFERAKEFERTIQAQDPHAWLTRECQPIETVDFTREPDLFGDYCDGGTCFV